MRYHDFDLWIETSASGGLTLRSSCKEHGEYRDGGAVDLVALQEAERNMVDTDAAAKLVLDMGTQLYGFVFASTKRHVEWHFAQCWGEWGRGDRGVRVRLRVESPSLATIPWEFLYSDRLESFLGVSTRTPVLRYLELPRAIGKLETALPVRILVIIPRVADLDTDVEKRELLEALAPLSEVSLTVLNKVVTRQDIADALLDKSFHVIHFMGHGDFNGTDAVLEVNTVNGGRDLIDHLAFAAMTRNHTTLKLVVLNSCRGGKLSGTKPLVGMAAALVKEGVPAVIAMQYEVMDDEAITFARTFYRALFKGVDRGRVEIALSHARNALASAYPETIALGVPVLFTHAGEGILFDIGSEGLVPDQPLSPRALRRDQATLATHKRNIQLLRAPGAAESQDQTALVSEELAYSKTARRVRLRQASIVAALASALIVFILSLAFGFQRLPARLRVEGYAVWLTDRFDRHVLDPSLSIVSVDRRSEAELGPMDSVGRFTWRARHAQLIDRLTSLRVRTIVFMFVFDTSAAAIDDSLVASILHAKQNGTEVVIGVDSFANRNPILVPSLARAAQWGPACLGDNRIHSLKMLPMMIAPVSSERPARIPSLALQSVAVHTRAAIDDRLPMSMGVRLSGRREPIRPSELLIAGGEERGCPSISNGDTLAEVYIEYSPLAELRAPTRHRSYVDVLEGRSGDAHLRNNLVIVGREVNDPRRTFKVQRALSIEDRTSVEIFTDAVNSLLLGSLIRPLGQGGQFLLILAMAMLGAAVASFVGGRAKRIVWLGAVFAGYVALAMWFYSAHHLLLNTVFHVIALVSAFYAVALLRRKWI